MTKFRLFGLLCIYLPIFYIGYEYGIKLGISLFIIFIGTTIITQENIETKKSN